MGEIPAMLRAFAALSGSQQLVWRSTGDIVWDDQRASLVTAPIIHQHDVERLLVVLCKLMQQELKVLVVSWRSSRK
jgi:hypothetical protein